MAKPTAAPSVQGQIDTHEGRVCWSVGARLLLELKRIEHIMIGTAGTTIFLLLSVIMRG